MARGSPKAPVEAARKDKKRHNPKRPHSKRADAVKAYAAFAARYQFQDARHTDREPVNHQCGYDHGGHASQSVLDEDRRSRPLPKNINPAGDASAPEDVQFLSCFIKDPL
jgi:hypothetical protein